MFAAQAAAHSIQEARILALLSIPMLIIFRHEIVRTILMTLAALTVTLLGLGLFTLIAFMHY